LLNQKYALLNLFLRVAASPREIVCLVLRRGPENRSLR
jgi:hypothetical protein